MGNLSISLFLIVASVFVAGCLAQRSCTRERDCDSVANGREFVTCTNGTCRCWTERGFTGNATTSNKCRCQWPRSVYQKYYNNYDDDDDDDDDRRRNNGNGRDDNSYCLDIASASAEVAKRDRCNQLEAITQYLYNLVVYPNNLPVLDDTSILEPFVDTNADSRFTPVGEFTGFPGFVEYYYALGSTPAGFVQSIKFRSIACDNNIVHFRVELVFNQTLSPIGPDIKFFNFTHVGYFGFGPDNRVDVADITFTNMGIAADVNASAVLEVAPGVTIPARAAFVQGICQQINLFCTGANQVYDSVQDCVNFMNTIPYGSFDRANSNTFTCRIVHTGLIPRFPDMHCPHVSRGGGGKCIDFPAVSYYRSPVESTLDALVAMSA